MSWQYHFSIAHYKRTRKESGSDHEKDWTRISSYFDYILDISYSTNHSSKEELSDTPSFKKYKYIKD